LVSPADVWRTAPGRIWSRFLELGSWFCIGRHVRRWP